MIFYFFWITQALKLKITTMWAHHSRLIRVLIL